LISSNLVTHQTVSYEYPLGPGVNLSMTNSDAGGVLALLYSYNSPVEVQTRLDQVDEDTRDIVQAVGGVSPLFAAFLDQNNVSFHELGFQSNVARANLSSRIGDTITIAVALWTLMDAFLEDYTQLVSNASAFDAFASTQCVALNNPVGVAYLQSICQRDQLRYRPNIFSFMNASDDRELCTIINASSVPIEDIWLVSWISPDLTAFSDGMCGELVAYLLKSFVYAPEDPSSYDPLPLIGQFQLRMAADQFLSQSRALYVPLNMLNMLNRDTPGTTFTVSRNWQINGGALVIMLIGASGLHWVLAGLIHWLQMAAVWCVRFTRRLSISSC